MAAQQDSIASLCPRLVDYICFVGARYPNSNSVAQTPELLRRYPLTDHNDFHLPPDVVFFCQPEGCISVSQKRVPLRDASSFVFTLTDKESGVIRYGICLNFFRPFDRKYVSEVKNRVYKANDSTSEGRNGDAENHRNRTGSNVAADTISQCSTDSDNLSWNGSLEGHNNAHRGSASTGGGRVKKWKQRNNTLTSLCLISHHPFFSTFRECLFQLRKLIHACNERSCSRRVGGSKSVLRDSVWGVLSGCSLGSLDPSSSHLGSGNNGMANFPGNGHEIARSHQFQHQNVSAQQQPPLSPVIVHDVKEIEHWIMRLLSAPIPIPGKTRVEVELLPRSISQPILFALPDDTRFSLCDFPLHLPLELLGVETCMKVLTCILLEHKIVLQSRDYNALSMSVLAFVKMLYPLEYMFPVIPLLPTCMNFAEQLLLAPTPYIIGVPATFFLYKQSFRLPDDVWVVDLDSNKITVPLSAEELPRIVEPEATTLRNHLKGALTSMSMPQPIRNLDEVDLSRFSISNSKSDNSKHDPSVRDAFNPYIFGNDIDSIDVATRVALVKFFSSQNVLANHYEHMRTLRLFPRPVVAFQLNSFLKSRPNHSAFTAKLARTQAVEYFCEWSLSPNNMTFQRIQTGIVDPGVIGDKPKWYSHQLTSIVFPVCAEGSSLAAALSVPEEQEDDSDANLTDESADEEAVSTHVSTSISGGAGGGLNPNSAGTTSVGMGGNHHHQTLHSSADVNSLKSSSSYSSLTEFVCDMRSADINGDCIPPTPSSNDVFPQRMLIDQSNYRVPKTLMVPKTEAQTGVETPCIPFNYNIHHPNTASGSKEGTGSIHMTSNEASTAVTLGSDGSYGGMGTSDTDNDADSIHSESDEAGGINGGGCSRDVGSSGGSSSDNRNAAQHPNAQYSSRSSQHQAASTEREFKNPLYDTSATRKAVSSTKNASAIAAPKDFLSRKPLTMAVVPQQVVPQIPLNPPPSQTSSSSPSGVSSLWSWATSSLQLKPTPVQTQTEPSIQDTSSPLSWAAHLPLSKSSSVRSAGSKRSSASAASASGEAHNEHVATLDPNILQAYDIIHSVESSSSAFSIDDVNVSSPSASESVNFKRQNDGKSLKPNANGSGQQSQAQLDSGFVSRSQSVSVGTGSARSSRLSSVRSEHNSTSTTSAYDKGDRTAFVEKTASVISRHSLKSGKALTNQIAAGGTRMASAFDRTTFKDPGQLLEQILGNDIENQQFLSEVVTNCMEGQAPGFFALKKLKKLLENESLRAYVVGKVGNNNDQPVSKDFLEDQEVSKKVFNSMTTVLRAVISGLEESIKAANFNGMASIFMLLEIAYTHVYIRDLTTTRKAIPNNSGNAAEIIKEQSLKKVEGVFENATKGFNQSLNFILSGDGAFSNLTVPPNSPNVSKNAAGHSQGQQQHTNHPGFVTGGKSAPWLAPFAQSQSQPESPKYTTSSVPAGVYTYPTPAASRGNGSDINNGNGDGIMSDGVGSGIEEPAFKPPYADPFASSAPGKYSNVLSGNDSKGQKDDRNPRITINKTRPGSLSAGTSYGSQSDDLVTEVDAKRKQMEAMHYTMGDSNVSCTTDASAYSGAGTGLAPQGGSVPMYPTVSGGVVYGESDGGSSGADTPASGGGLSGPSFVNEKGLRRISHHSIRSTDSEFEVTSQGFRPMPQLAGAGGGLVGTSGSVVPKIPNQVKQVKSVYCNGYRYYSGILMKLENMPPQEENPKKYLFEMLIESNRSPLWDNLQFWEDCFLDAVAAEREAVGMDQSPHEMMNRYKTLGVDEQKRIEAEEDRLLSTTLHNMVAFMLAMKLNPKDIKKKARRLLGRSHIGLGFSKEVNDLLDRIHYLAGNDVDLKPPVSRQLRRQCFVVHAGVDNKGDVLFLEVCEDSVILRSGNGVICERLFYEKLINMSYSPSTKVLCLWKRHGCETLLTKYYTKKCKQLYYAIKDSMERAATRIRNETPELGGEFCVEDVTSGACGVLQVTLDGISLNFNGQKVFIDLRDIKKCNTKKGLFVLQEYVPERREVFVRKYKSAQANEICYAVLCVFSMVAAATSPSSPPNYYSQGSGGGSGAGGGSGSSTSNRNSCCSPIGSQQVSSIASNL
ncbi:MAP kinase-activating death domain protein-like isoform X3 [Convolutriloba macropyga]|uniref:MAP kinase-activating death domain protein-like isoform X3 n=1 Tax=Convolutriloba macropyga TaxID=536237 RepID=UPI003F520CF8